MGFPGALIAGFATSSGMLIAGRVIAAFGVSSQVISLTIPSEIL